MFAVLVEVGCRGRGTAPAGAGPRGSPVERSVPSGVKGDTWHRPSVRRAGHECGFSLAVRLCHISPMGRSEDLASARGRAVPGAEPHPAPEPEAPRTLRRALGALDGASLTI